MVGLFDTAIISPGNGWYTSTSGSWSGNTGWNMPGCDLKFSIIMRVKINYLLPIPNSLLISFRSILGLIA